MESPSLSTKLIVVTPNAEVTMAYIARNSNPKGQATTNEENAGRLLRFCLRENHWSVFEHAYMTVEVTTLLYVATQMLRHRSFTFAQFSQRYANVDALTGEGTEGATTWAQAIRLRMQDHKNRQNSTDDCPPDVAADFHGRIQVHLEAIHQLYTDMLDTGIAKECARAILPQCTTTRLYLTGNCRSWIHYIQQRTKPDTQAEHRDMALAIKDIFCDCFPTVAAALEWGKA